jgi:hypothetical protein
MQQQELYRIAPKLSTFCDSCGELAVFLRLLSPVEQGQM